MAARAASGVAAVTAAMVVAAWVAAESVVVAVVVTEAARAAAAKAWFEGRNRRSRCRRRIAPRRRARLWRAGSAVLAGVVHVVREGASVEAQGADGGAGE